MVGSNTKLWKVLVPVVFVALSFNAVASTPLCAPKSGTELFKCLREQHVDIKKSEFDIEKADGELRQSGNFQNPELGVTGIFGDNFGQKTTEFQTDLQFTIELGGKRSSRKNRAKAEKGIAEIESKLTRDRVIIESGQTVLRLKQLEKEISSFKEALDTFSRIEKQYRSRGRLSPEQEVSLAIFEVAAKDTALKLNGFHDEQKLIRDNVAVTLGLDAETPWNALEFTNFQPRLPTRYQEKSANPVPHIAKAELENRRAEMNYSLERANAWPDFKIGPVLTVNNEGSDRFYSGGFALSIPLPILNLNGGARAAASAEAQKARLELQRQTLEIKRLKARLVENYERLQSHISKMNDFDAIDKKHRRLESLFSQGVVSSALVIESHRQLLEFLEEYHAAERTQLETLWKLYSLEDRLAQESLL